MSDNLEILSRDEDGDTVVGMKQDQELFEGNPSCWQ